MAVLEAELSETIQLREAGADVTVTKLQGFVKTIVRASLAGDTHAAKILVTLLQKRTDDQPDPAAGEDEELYAEYLAEKEQAKK
jgi:hypothetical protein